MDTTELNNSRNRAVSLQYSKKQTNYDTAKEIVKQTIIDRPISISDHRIENAVYQFPVSDNFGD